MILPFEVPKYSTSRKEFDTKFVIPILESQVFMFFKTYISIDAYNCFKEKQIPINNLLEFSFNVDYPAGQYVRYDDVLYMKKVDGGATNIPPFNSPLYEEAKRFNDNFLQELWENHLRGVLAQFVLNCSTIPATYQITSRGALKAKENNLGDEVLGKSEMSLLMDAMDTNLYAMVEFMKNYIELNKENIPCLKWKSSCGCGGEDKSPVENKSYGAREFYFLEGDY